MLVKDLRQMLAEALRIGHARCVVLFTIERHTDTLSSGWFHGADSPYGAVCSIHSIGREVESSYCLHRFSTNHEIRWNQDYSASDKPVYVPQGGSTALPPCGGHAHVPCAIPTQAPTPTPV